MIYLIMPLWIFEICLLSCSLIMLYKLTIVNLTITTKHLQLVSTNYAFKVFIKTIEFFGLSYISFIIFFSVLSQYLLCDISQLLVPFEPYLRFCFEMYNCLWWTFSISQILTYTVFLKSLFLIFFGLYYIILYYYSKILLIQQLTYIKLAYELPFILSCNWIGYNLVLCSDNLFLVYLGIEIQTFIIFIILSQFKKNLLISTTNLKYFFYSIISSLFFLMGLIYILNFSGSLNYSDLYIYFYYLTFPYVNAAQWFSIVGSYLIILSLCFKLGVAPFIIWVLDIMEGLPTIILILFLTLNKFNIYLFLLQFSKILSISQIAPLYTVIAYGSLLYGGLLSLTQTNWQRFFGATSIAHMGFLLLLLKNYLITITTTTLLIIYSYFILYILLTFCFLSIYLFFIYQNQSLHFKLLNYYFMMSPRYWAALILCLLNFSGFPPFTFFFIKLNMLWCFLITWSYIDLLFGLYISILLTGSYFRMLIVGFYGRHSPTTFIFKINQNNNFNLIYFKLELVVVTLAIYLAFCWLI